jgi:hypothetical protein
MGRDRTGAYAVKNSLRVKISILKERGILKEGAVMGSSYSWTNGASITVIGYWKEEKRFIQLMYTQSNGKGEKKTFDYKVPIVGLPSNLGKGELLYFVCPVSGKRCRTLYLAYNAERFQSREAYKRPLYYNSQWQSKYDYWLTRYWDYKEEVEAFREKPKKTHYQGKPTRIMKRLEEMEERLDYYDKRKEDIFNRRAANWGTSLF